MNTVPAVPRPTTNRWFEAKILNFNLPPGADPRTTTFPLQSKENESLALAERERFDEMCSKILWGSEDPEAFGEMLRSLVVSFLPSDSFQLRLLRNVASAQWQLQRIEAIQQNLFLAGAEEIGAYKLPAGTADAMDFSNQASNLLRDLQRSIQIYHAARKRK